MADYSHLTFARHDLDIPQLITNLKTYGCVLIRQLFPGAIFQSLLPRAQEAFAHWEAHLDSWDPLFKQYYELHHNQIPAYELARAGEDALWFYHLFLTTPLVDIMHAYFGPRYFFSILHTICRRQMPSRPAWFTQFHQDGYFLEPDWTVIHCWTPMVPCGVDAPTLEMIPAGLKAIRPHQHKENRGEHYWDNRDMDLETEILPYFPAENFWTLILEPGDAILYDNFALHRTYCTPQMDKDRYNLEIRFLPNVDLPEKLRAKGVIPVGEGAPPV